MRVWYGSTTLLSGEREHTMAVEQLLERDRPIVEAALKRANAEREVGRETTQWRDSRFRVLLINRSIFVPPYELASLISAVSA
jgi:hypothetical protein